MDLDALLEHYFASVDPDAIDAAQFAAGKERLTIDFGVEQEPSRKFALWALMEALGFAPTPADAFEDAGLKRAADDYLSAAWRLEQG